MAYQADIDFGRVNVLMKVVHNVATIAPQCTHILGFAMDELNAINQEAQVAVEDKRKQDAAAIPPPQPALVTDPAQGTFINPSASPESEPTPDPAPTITKRV